MEIIGKSIDPTRIGNRQIDGRPYWHVITDVDYSVGGNQRKGVLLIAPIIGYERAVVRTPSGQDFEMSPAYYGAELLLDQSYTILTLRFFRSEIDDKGKDTGRRPIDALPSPLVQDFIACVKELLGGGVRVVRPLASGFDVLAAEFSSKSKAKGGTKKKSSASKSKAKGSAKKKAPASKSKSTGGTKKKAPASKSKSTGGPKKKVPASKSKSIGGTKKKVPALKSKSAVKRKKRSS